METIITKRVGKIEESRCGFLGIDRNKKESSIYDSILGLETMEEILFTVRLLFCRHWTRKHNDIIILLVVVSIRGLIDRIAVRRILVSPRNFWQ